MVEIKIKWEQEVWFFVGPKNNLVVAQGTIQGIYINRNYQIEYLAMDAHVVYTKNEKYKKGEYLKSREILNDEIGDTVFLSKDEIKNKLRELRRINNG